MVATTTGAAVAAQMGVTTGMVTLMGIHITTGMVYFSLSGGAALIICVWNMNRVRFDGPSQPASGGTSY